MIGARHRKTNTVWPHLYVESKIIELIEAESRMVDTREGAGIGKWGGDSQRVYTSSYTR